MAPLRAEPDKYLTNEPETACYDYSPTFGGSVVDDPNIIDPNILASFNSGVQFQSLRIQITNRRILIGLVMPSCRQNLEMYYEDLRTIEVGQSRGLLHQVSLHDSRGLGVWLNASRPHFRAVELWMYVTCVVGSHFIKIGQLEKALSIVGSIDVSSIKIPEYFLLRSGGNALMEWCSKNGICLPINQSPYWQPPQNLLASQPSRRPITAGHDTIDHLSDLSFQSSVSISTALPKTTADLVSSGGIQVSPGEIPIFMPSLAELPATTNRMDTLEDELHWAIHNSPNYFQSFYNDLCPISSKGINDDVISGNCFDEGLYCALVKEMHRYTIAEVAANQDDIAKSNAGLGAMVGSFLGLITGNIFAPFLGHTYGKNMTDRSRRIEEFLPDPVLLFNQDPNSFLSWSRGQVSSPRLRRMILDRQVDSENRVYFRLLPAIVTADSVYPIQLFKLLPSTYFYRPLAAGIGDDSGRKQPNYDAIKIQRKYFHIRAEGEVTPTDISLKVFGRDIEDYDVKLYRYVGHSLDYFYADFKIQPGSVF